MPNRIFSWIDNNYWIFILLIAGISLAGLTDMRKNRIWSDAEGYYMYLPAVLSMGDFTMTFL